MSTSFSANQYENAFNSQKLQNWTVPKHFKERPSAAEGYTTFIATDRGHLLPGVRTKHGSAWPSFQGTWDLPRRIPPVHINPTARSQGGQDRLRTWGWTKSATIQAHEAPLAARHQTEPFKMWKTYMRTNLLRNQKCMRVTQTKMNRGGHRKAQFSA